LTTTAAEAPAVTESEPAVTESEQSPVQGVPRPFVKWVGGKRQLLPHLLKYVPPAYGTYFEPFVGGGALYFSVRPAVAVLSDNNARLVRTYRGIRDDVERVIRILRTYRFDRPFFTELRNLDVDSAESDAEVAAWFIYLNKMGYNGLYRVNQKNRFNVPFGDYKNPNVCDAPTLRACSQALRAVEIVHGDFREVAERAKAGDFVYFDPPYVPLSVTSSFTSYTADGFGMEEHRGLRDLALRLRSRDVHVLLSNSSAQTVRELYADEFKILEVKATRMVNSKATERGHITELLIR
jgi:DNA adenine methylase